MLCFVVLIYPCFVPSLCVIKEQCRIKIKLMMNVILVGEGGRCRLLDLDHDYDCLAP